MTSKPGNRKSSSEKKSEGAKPVLIMGKPAGKSEEDFRRHGTLVHVLHEEASGDGWCDARAIGWGSPICSCSRPVATDLPHPPPAAVHSPP